MKWEAMGHGYFAGIRRRNALRCRFQKTKTGAVALALSKESLLQLADIYRGCKASSLGRRKVDASHGTFAHNVGASSCRWSTPAAWSRSEDRAILEATKGKGNACHATFVGVACALNNRTHAEVQARYNALLAAYNMSMRKRGRNDLDDARAHQYKRDGGGAGDHANSNERVWRKLFERSAQEEAKPVS